MANLTLAEKQLLTSLIQPVKSRLHLAWAISVISTLIFVAQAWFLASLFEFLFTQYSSDTLINSNTYQLWHYVIGLSVCLFVRPLCTFFAQRIGVQASLQVRSTLRQQLLSSLANLGMARQQFGNDGNLSSQIVEQTDALDGYISRFIVQKNVVLSTPIILLIACAWQSLVVAIILLLTAPFVPLLMIIIGRMTAKKSAKQFSALAQLSGRFLDWIRGMKTLKRMQATDVAERDLANASEDYRKRTMEVLKVAFLNGAVLEFLSSLCIALVAIYLGLGLLGELDWAKDYISVNYFMAVFVLLLTPEFYAPLRQLGVDYHAQAHAQGAVKSLLPLLKKADEIQALHEHEDTIVLDHHHSPRLDVNDLAIYQHIYDPMTQQTITRTRLKPIRFHIQAGQRIGLMGDSGSGKSSLFQMLMGFSDYQGQVLINGVDYSQINILKFREQIGYLAQQVALLPISIADNLRLANPDTSDDELIEVLTLVDLYELIRQLPQGIHTCLGERGQGLSGGQQQRLGVAQLLLTQANFWLLDEPTEHLDPDTAQTIHQLLEELSRDKTLIWITHNAEVLQWLDDVVKIDT